MEKFVAPAMLAGLGATIAYKTFFGTQEIEIEEEEQVATLAGRVEVAAEVPVFTETNEAKAQRLYTDGNFAERMPAGQAPSSDQITALLSADGSSIDQAKVLTLITLLTPEPVVHAAPEPAVIARGLLMHADAAPNTVQLREYTIADGEAEGLLNADGKSLGSNEVLILLRTKRKEAFATGTPDQKRMVQLENDVLDRVNLKFSATRWASFSQEEDLKKGIRQFDSLVARIDEDTALMIEGKFAELFGSSHCAQHADFKSQVVEKILSDTPPAALSACVDAAFLKPVVSAPVDAPAPKAPTKDVPAAPEDGKDVPVAPKDGKGVPAAQVPAVTLNSWATVKSYITVLDTDGIMKTLAKRIGLVFMVALFPLTLIGRFIICPLVDRCYKVEPKKAGDDVKSEKPNAAAKK